jgi:hypothetical protein
LIISVNTIAAVNATIDVAINTDGVFYWHMFVNSTVTFPLELVAIKADVKVNDYIIE